MTIRIVAVNAAILVRNSMKWLWKLVPHFHTWKHPIEKGEEEHGPNPTLKFCTKCGKELALYGDRISGSYHWDDTPSEKLKELMKNW